MELKQLLANLGAKSVKLRRDGESMVISAAKDALDKETMQCIREHKDALLKMIDEAGTTWWCPPRIITPELLPLIKLTQSEIDTIVKATPGGTANIRDIYPLSPLQEGILFHHIAAQEGDPYIWPFLFAFDNREVAQSFVKALQAVVERHDILRTAILWEGLPEPVQVVWHRAPIVLEEISVDPGRDVEAQMKARFDPRHYRLDLKQAPMLRFTLADDPRNNRFVLMVLIHHLIGDHTTLNVIQEEIEAYQTGRMDQLPKPMPYRNYVARARLGPGKEAHEAFFRKMLGDIVEPTAPYGILDVQGDGARIKEGRLDLNPALSKRVRERARRTGVSAASLCHHAWAMVLALLTGRERVVFGTVIFGRMQGSEGISRGIGLFINTLPVRIDVDGAPIEASLHKTHTVLAELMQHEYASLSLAQRCSGVQAPAPLFTSLFNFRHNMGERPLGNQVSVFDSIKGLFGEERTNYPFTLSVDDWGLIFSLHIMVHHTVDAKRVCELMHCAMERIVEALEKDPQTPVNSLSILPDVERRRVLQDWNATEAPFPQDLCAHELFESQALLHPDAMALTHRDRSLSYGELNAAANRLAHRLISQGVKPDTFVCICAKRSIEMIIGCLAVLKAGGAYVPMDPAYPVDRLRHMVSDCHPVAILTLDGMIHSLGVLDQEDNSFFKTLPVLELGDEIIDQDAYNPSRELTGLRPDHLAYLIYTSGSTGTPKGVMVEHGNLVNLITWHAKAFDIKQGTRSSHVAGVSFDASVWEVWPTLCSGGILLLPEVEGAVDPTGMLAWWKNQELSVSFLPTPMAEFAFANRIIHPTLKHLLIGGDRLHRFPQGELPFALINNYGPTECTVVATSGRLDGTESRLHIGRPIANTQIYILDEKMRPVPTGVSGELYIGGAGVTRGYLNLSEMTESRFISNPFGPGRLYKTGDLGCWMPDGNIDFIGRNDFQVKIRGYRIELGEIESRLLDYPALREAAVLAREDMPGGTQLVAYYVSEMEIHADDLKGHLSRHLPDHMIPVAFMRLGAIPFTANGKLDRKALPAPHYDAFARHEFESPMGEMESLVASIWAEVLHVETISRHDNFFELGGHSLLTIRVISWLREAMGVEISLDTFFERPVLRDFARSLSGASRRQLPPVTPSERGETIPLSFAQQRLWFIAQMEGASAAYHIRGGLRLHGHLDKDALRRALDRVVQRHEALRTTFLQSEGEPVQIIAPGEGSRFHLIEQEARSEAELLELMEEEYAIPFDLARGPLVRGRIIREAFSSQDEGNAPDSCGALDSCNAEGQTHTLLMTMHHIVSDGWSMGVLVNELSALYSAFTKGEADPLPELPVQYADYAIWQRNWVSGALLHSQAEFWIETLSGAPELLELQTDHPRPAVQDYAGSVIGFELDEQLSESLKALSFKHGSTLFMTMIAAWGALLGRLSNQEDVVIGMPSANRSSREIEGLIGFFVNTLALRLDLSGRPTVASLLEQAKTRTLKAQVNQDIPFEFVVERVNPSRSTAHSPLFQVMFAWQNNEEGELDLGGMCLDSLPVTSHATAQFDLTLSLQEMEGCIVGGLEYATSLFEKETVERFLDCYRMLLEGMVADDKRSVDSIPILPESMRRLVLETFNDTAQYCPSEPLNVLFEAQVDLAPDACAVLDGGQALTYGELNARANRLAHHLVRMGVQPGESVAVFMERSVDLVAAEIAVLKAGAVYVPMDSTFPMERMQFMLRDCGARVLLAQSGGDTPSVDGVRRVDVDVLETVSVAKIAEGAPVAGNLAAMGSSNAAAYIMYTSGSTGQPKGVVVPHRAITRLVINNGYADFNASDRVAFAANPAFDASTMEVWAPLLNGGTLVVIAQDDVLDPKRFARELRENAVSVLWMTVGLFNRYVNELEDEIGALRYLMVGGDALDVRTIRRVLDNKRPAHLLNGYGPTETTTFAATHEITGLAQGAISVPIGRPIGNTTVYILDKRLQPVPIGVAGELYIGGLGVALGYLNSPDLTKERFLPDPFIGSALDDHARLMYKTGDLGRWLPDGTIDFLGRNDFQVKLRGFRIELGEIEARLLEVESVRHAAVIIREDIQGDKRLVAYYTTDAELAINEIREHLLGRLPEYMIPAAFVYMDSLPLTRNGKVDRKALPDPEEDSYAKRQYEAPEGEIEERLAAIWSELLHVEKVGRFDNFFELGGHSLLTVTLIEKMRQQGIHADVKTLFASPTLAQLAAGANAESRCVIVPANLIPEGCTQIVPEMLPLAKLTRAAIDSIASKVEGGQANIQDIYPLAPLQEGMFFHYLMAGGGDAYTLFNLFAFESRERLDAFIAAMQFVVDRHDILRTSIAWENLPEPMQVVWRKASLPVEEVALETGKDAVEQLMERFDPRHYRLDLRRAPMMKLSVAFDPEAEEGKGCWLLHILWHHLVGDHTTLDVMVEEIQAFLAHQADSLPEPVQYRNLVAQARLGLTSGEHERFFRRMLWGITEPTAPFGVMDVQGDGTSISEDHLEVDPALAARLREKARSMGVSAASLCHLAWGQVLSRLTGLEEVVFGTVLFGRMQAGESSYRGIGLFINTLPIRVTVGLASVESSLRRTQEMLAELLRHEHAPLALAQRCSGVQPPTPLFTSLLNYRHSGNASGVTEEDLESVAALETGDESVDVLSAGGLSGDVPSGEMSAWEGMEEIEMGERTNYPVTLSVDDLGDGFALKAQVHSSINPERVCAFMHQALEVLVSALETSPTASLRSLDILPREERRVVLETLNETGAPFPVGVCVHTLFEQQVERTPQAAALSFQDRTLTYVELNAAANRLAHRLVALGVKPDSRVALCLERSLEMVIGILGVLKAGGAYVPMDPGYPAERLGQILLDSAPEVILTKDGLFQSLAISETEQGTAGMVRLSDLGDAQALEAPPQRPRVILELTDSFEDYPEGNPDIEQLGLHSRHLAYVMYTSGSTGKPKGVMIEHHSLVNHMAWMQDTFPLSQGEAVIQKTPINFDASVWEFYAPLLCGGRLVMADPGMHRDPDGLAALLLNEKIHTLQCVPTLLSMLLDAHDFGKCLSLRRVFCGGEVLAQSVVERFHALLPQAQLINLYGPTEATIDATYWICPRDEKRPVVIGRPISNARAYILDARRHPAPVGVPGELYIGGDCVGRGYLNLSELTAERFLPDPFAAARTQSRAATPSQGAASDAVEPSLEAGLGGSGGRTQSGPPDSIGKYMSGRRPMMYRTGDLVRWLPDGTLDFIGRNDFQVKIRGFRVELGEIESRIMEHPNVREVVVIAREDVPGDKRLVAYFTAQELLGPEVLRTHLTGHLPEYMIPAAFVQMGALPLTPNGKLDRKSLPMPEGDAYAKRRFEAPQPGLETLLAGIWSELLNVEGVGRQDNFFDLGGHSLLTVQVISRLRQSLGIEVSLSQVFAKPVLADFAAGLASAARTELPPIIALPRTGNIPLSFAQQRLWFLSQMEGASEAYHIPSGFRLRGYMDREALRQALDTIQARHEALRTTFAKVNGTPVQIIAPVEESRFTLVEQTVQSEDELRQVVEEEFTAPFDMERGPLARGRLIREAFDETSEEGYTFLVTMHHIVSDGWSMGVLISEFSALYSAFAKGEANPLPPLDVQYADYVFWQRRWVSGEFLQEQANYWKRRLAGSPELLELPTDHPRPSVQDFSGASLDFEIPEALTLELKALSRRHGATLFMTLLAGWGLLLSRLANQEDIAIGTPSANRGRREIEGLIGFFINTLVMRMDLSGNPTVAALMEQVKSRALEAQANQDIPFEHVVEVVNPVRAMAHSPLFQVMFVWQNNAGGALEMPGLHMEVLEEPDEACLEMEGEGETCIGEDVYDNSFRSTSAFDMTLSLGESADGISGDLEYATALFERETMERLLAYYLTLLEGMVADDARTVNAIPYLPVFERRLLLETFNDTAVELPTGCYAHRIFEEQAALTPEVPALIAGDQTLSYGELNARANRLAHRLRASGIAVDNCVAICVEKSVEMMVAMLAVLKAGGAYVPMDPGYPVERLLHMMKESDAKVLLCKGDGVHRLAAELSGSLEGLQILDLEQNFDEQPGTNPDPLEVGLEDRHLAYVCYTSGSTGLPKGVMVEHRSLWNLCQANHKIYGMEAEDRVLQFIPYIFDGSLEEIFGAFKAGACLVLRGGDWSLDAAGFWTKCEEYSVSIVDLPTRFWMALAMESAPIPSCVRMVIIYGEAVEERALNAWFARKGHLPRLFNTYGPTETTVNATVRELTADASQWRSLGGPLDNVRLYVLDAHGQPVPVGVTGELHIGGLGVSRGYLNRPEQSAEVFLSDPYLASQSDAIHENHAQVTNLLPTDKNDFHGRMYKTGDLVRWLPDGTIEFMGRNDFQVKIRGFRIELGEVEARMLEHAHIRNVAAIAREDIPGDKRLVVYFTSDVDIIPDELRNHLTGRLPDYMVPAAYVRLESLPLTPNGKLDRQALPVPGDAAYAKRAYEAPRGDMENMVAEMWAKLLNVEKVGRNDHFFELGGHSLLTVRAISWLRETLGIEVPLTDFFERPVLSHFVKGLSNAAIARMPPIVPAERIDKIPLSFAQQRLWFLAQIEGASEAYHMPEGMRIRGALDKVALRRALNTIMDRHEVLRTIFSSMDGEPIQIILPSGSMEFQLTEQSVGSEDELSAALLEEFTAPFDMETGPMVRGRLVQESEDLHTLMVTMHHIVSDGWSIGILVNEFGALYNAFSKGEENPLPPLEVQYADYAIWQRRWVSGDLLKNQSEYWRKTLGGVPEFLELPTDFPRPVVQNYQGTVLDFEINGELTESLRAFSRRHGTTLFMTMLAAWGVLLSRMSNQEDVLVGTPSANRAKRELEGLIGCFVNTLVIRMDLSNRPTVAQFLEQVKTRTLTAQANQDVPFEYVVELVNPVRSMAHPPLFQVMFSWQSNEEGYLDMEGLDLESMSAEHATESEDDVEADVEADVDIDSETGIDPEAEAGEGADEGESIETAEGLSKLFHSTSKLDITLSLRELDYGMVGVVEYATSLFEKDTIERMLGHYAMILEGMVADETRCINDLSILLEDERAMVLESFNETAAEYPLLCIHELFEQQAAQAPDALAVVFGEESLTYGELNHRANRLAHRLIALGVKPDSAVALCVERSLEMVVGLLGILKAGGAYVPMDPAYPVDRLRHMVRDAKPPAVVTLDGLFQRLEILEGDELSTVELPIVDLRESFEEQPDENPAEVGTQPDHLAYVIYTSGSTGMPKGVMVPHRGVVNMLQSIAQDLEFTAQDRLLALTTIAFDIAALELYMPLTIGASIALVSRAEAADPIRLAESIHGMGVTVMQATPATWRLLLEAGWQGDKNLTVICGGEALTVDLSERLCENSRVLWNVYGPTETTVWSTTAMIEEAGASGLINESIGRPIANTQIYILDMQGNPVPVGVIGEIFIAGDGVARGYMNRPDLTAERFMNNPFAAAHMDDRPGKPSVARMYKTGDLGRWRDDGNIEFLGRNDFQVKIRGFRIELGEIEARLAAHPDIKDAVVMAREDVPGDKRLVAYFVSSKELTIEALRSHLSAKVPDYMIPSAFIQLDAMPLTPNGKVDRKILPPPEESIVSTREYVAPEGDVEIKLAAIWQKLLNVEKVGRNDSFFELGGHSLLTVTLMERMRAVGLNISIQSIFAAPTLAVLAASVSESEDQSETILIPENLLPDIGPVNPDEPEVEFDI